MLPPKFKVETNRELELETLSKVKERINEIAEIAKTSGVLTILSSAHPRKFLRYPPGDIVRIRVSYGVIAFVNTLVPSAIRMPKPVYSYIPAILEHLKRSRYSKIQPLLTDSGTLCGVKRIYSSPVGSATTIYTYRKAVIHDLKPPAVPANLILLLITPYLRALYPVIGITPREHSPTLCIGDLL